jgi:hypothetical protein
MNTGTHPLRIELNCVRYLILFLLVASEDLAFTSILSPVAQADALSGRQRVVDTSICELVDHPRAFSGKVVRIQAQYESDGIEYSTLSDPTCADFGVKPAGELDSSVGSKLSDVLRRGCAGTTDKRITATWIGVFHWNPKNLPGTGKVPRWLDVRGIEQLRVQPRTGAPICAHQ